MSIYPITTLKSGIIRGTKYRNAPAMLEASEGATWKVSAPMPDHSIPSATEETTEIPEGFCQCGCGKRVGRYTRNDSRIGAVAGQYRRWIRGHSRRPEPSKIEVLADSKTAKVCLGDGHHAIVSVEDIPLISGYRWKTLNTKGRKYAFCSVGVDGTQQTRLMHRVILGVTDQSVLVDHRDNDGLNNTRSNIRLASHADNQANRVGKKNTRSRYKGVMRYEDRGVWRARIIRNGKLHFIGSFTDEADAARAYDDAARELHGEFARLNFPREGERGARS